MADAPDLAAATAAIDRWIAALNAPQDAAHTSAAFSEDAVIERCGVDGYRETVLDTHAGHQAIATWIARVPDGTVFTRTSDVSAVPDAADGPTWTARYRIAIEDFEGGGYWRVRLAADGRLSWIYHQPDDLDSPVQGDQR